MCVYYSSKLLSNTIKSIFFILFTLIYVFHDDDDDDNHYRQIKFQKICFFLLFLFYGCNGDVLLCE